MRKIVAIITLVLLFYLIEQVLFRVLGKLLLPNFLIILIVFVDLSFGSRYSLTTAFICGFLKDSFSANDFGLNMIAFGVSALAVTIFRNYYYRKGSEGSRLLLVAFAVTINVAAQYLLRLMHGKVFLFEVLQFVFLPEIFLTVAVSLLTINTLRRCVSRLFAW